MRFSTLFVLATATAQSTSNSTTAAKVSKEAWLEFATAIDTAAFKNYAPMTKRYIREEGSSNPFMCAVSETCA